MKKPPPEGVRTLCFHTYRTATDNPSHWFKWRWNEYQEVLTESGVGVRIGGGLQIGRRMFSVRWRRFPHRRGCAPDCEIQHEHRPVVWQ